MLGRALNVATACALLLLSSTVALAHTSSLTYTTIEIGDEGSSLELSLRISRADLAEALGLDPETKPSTELLRLNELLLYKYVLRRLKMETTPAMNCTLASNNAWKDKQPEDAWYLAWSGQCPEPITALTFHYNLFFDLDPLHISALTAVSKSGRASAILREGQRKFVWNLQDPPPSGFLGFLRSGIDHILFGFDHLLFLMSLLVMAVVTRRDRSFELRGGAAGIRYALTIVTSFTIAHSITLVWAALATSPISSRIVESMIALSIVYVAVENIVRPDPPRRYLVTFCFGLVHGLGFASMLREILPASEAVIPALAFNLGVEVGQIGIVLVVLPVLALLAAKAGAQAYQRWFLRGASIALALAGGLWLVERALDLSFMPF